jgi:hypothetical protein
MRRSAAAAAVPAVLAALALAACGGVGGPGALAPDRLPLVAGARVLARVEQCDRGAHPFCAVDLVVVDRRLDSSGALVAREHEALRRAGWSDASGDFGQERASDSPGHRLHVVYATALTDLTGVDEDWIKRPRSLALALAGAVFARVPAMAVTLEAGPA